MRVQLRLMVLVVIGVLLIGLISLPFVLITSWDWVFGDGGLADQLLNIFAYGLLIVLIIVPFALGGVALVWQPGRDTDAKTGRRAKQPYRVWKAAAGLALIYASVMLVREIVTSDAPFPTSHADAARRAAAE